MASCGIQVASFCYVRDFCLFAESVVYTAVLKFKGNRSFDSLHISIDRRPENNERWMVNDGNKIHIQTKLK